MENLNIYFLQIKGNTEAEVKLYCMQHSINIYSAKHKIHVKFKNLYFFKNKDMIQNEEF